MSEIFNWIYELLQWISNFTGLTYREVNIVVYFIIIPSFFIYLISRIFKKLYLILGFLVTVFFTVLLIPDFEVFSNWLFDRSVDFLNWFDKFGLSYVEASVVVCVFFPIIVLILLFYLKKNNFKMISKN